MDLLLAYFWFRSVSRFVAVSFVLKVRKTNGINWLLAIEHFKS